MAIVEEQGVGTARKRDVTHKGLYKDASKLRVPFLSFLSLALDPRI